MNEENVAIVLDGLCRNGKSDARELSRITGIDTLEVQAALRVLSSFGVISGGSGLATSEKKFDIVKKVDAFKIALCAQFGLNLIEFKDSFNLTKKEIDAAKNIAASAEEVKKLSVESRPPMLFSRAYLMPSFNDVFCGNLSLLLEATNASLYSYINELAKKDKHLKILIDTHKQSENTLRDYFDKLK